MKFYQMPKEQVVKELDSNQVNGLTNYQFRQNIAQYGQNKLPEAPRENWLMVFLRQFRSPLIYILLIAAVIIYFVGHDKLDAFIISGVLFFNAMVGAIQEGRARNILDSLKRFIKTESVVVRDGKKMFVEDIELVPGDIILLLEGERVPADARVLESNNLKIDEAILTGESRPVKKVSEQLQKELPVHDQENMVFKGTYILSGSGKAIVIATGSKTEIGKIHKVAEFVESDMPLRRELNNLSRWILLFILVMCVVIFAIGLLTGKPIRELLVMLTALFICVIPEGLPVVLTLVLVMGAYKLAKRNVLVKRMQAVEALGQTNVILIDKTGTLTRNELMVSKVISDGKEFTVSGVGYFPQGEVFLHDKKITTHDNGRLARMAKAGCLLNRAEIHYMPEINSFEIKGDPTEASMFVFSQKLGIRKDCLAKECHFIYEIPFSSLWQYHAVFCEKNGKGMVYISGSPEVLLERSLPISQDEKNKLYEMLHQGLRTVAVAIKEFDADTVPKNMDEKEKRAFFEKIIASNLDLVGFFGIQDSIRPEVPSLVMDSRAAGLKVIMITGDHKETALYVARKVGIYIEGDYVIDGKQLSMMSDKELQEKINDITVYARVAPDQKVRIVETLRKAGNIIAMTGDGVNDAPSLMAADLGIAMGGIGTEVAKQAADMVLLDDSFVNIVFAVEYGRHIFYTLRRVVLYFFATNMGEVLVILFTISLGLPLPITAAQILWLNLITDGFLDTALATEKPQKDILRKYPQNKGRYRLVDKTLLWKMLYMALPMGIFSTWIFMMYYKNNLVHARSMTLVTMAMFQWFNAFNCRSETKSVFQIGFFSNRWLLLAVTVVFILQIFVLHNPLMQRIFDTKPISIFEWIMILVISSSIFFMEEIRKFFVRRYWKNS